MGSAVGVVPSGAELAKLQGQMKAWREDLMALDRRQKLLYFQHPKVGSLEFLLPKMGELESWLEAGAVHLISHETELEDRATAETLGLPTGKKTRVATVQGKNESQILSTCKRLHQRSEQEFADRGVWILYIGLGMLNWVDPADGKRVSSPLKLIPVRLERAGTRFTLRRTGDEAVVNSSLALKMARDFALEMPTFEDSDFTVQDVIDQTAEAIAGETDWSVDTRSILMPFTFHKEAMYKDLADNEERIMASGLIRVMALGPEAGNADSFAFELADDSQLDELVAPETLHSILDADGSQRKCIIAAREGRSFVMDGPPGTGKSQTIANIIAELMAVGKTVLFVSEKAAALDVVRDRLSARKLDPFLLELHSHKATRKQVVETLSKELTQKPMARSKFDGTDQSRLEASRLALSGYAAAMNQIRQPLGRSLHSVLGRILQLADVEKFPTGEKAHFAGLSAEMLGEVQRHGEDLSRAWRPALEQEDFLWRGLAGTKLDADRAKSAALAALQVSQFSQEVLEQAFGFDGKLPFLTLDVSHASLEIRRRTLELLEARPPVPDAWLTGPFSPVENRAAEWRQCIADRTQWQAQLGASFTQWQPADHSLRGPLEKMLSAKPELPLPGGLANLTVQGALAAQGRIRAMSAEIQALAPDAIKLAGLFEADPNAISLRTLAVLCSLAELSLAGNRPEVDWLNPAVHGALDDSARVLSGAIQSVRQKQQELQGIFAESALQLDLSELHRRFEHEHTGFKRWSKQSRADRKTLRSVTVTGVVNKSVIAALPGAIAWQQAQQQLYATERAYGPRLKSYYQGMQTDFGRVHQAIDLARRATELAGNDVSLHGLAAQLSTNTEPDRLLMPIANAITARTTKLTALMAETLTSDFQAWAADAPLSEVLDYTEVFAANLATADVALARLTAMDAGPLTLAACADGLALIGRLVDLDAKNDAEAAADSALLGRHFAGLNTSFSALDADLAWCKEVRQNLNAPLDAEAMKYLKEFTSSGLGLGSLLSQWDAAVETLADYFDAERMPGIRAELGKDLAGTVELAGSMQATATTDIDLWFEYQRIRVWATQHGMGATVAGLERAGAAAAQLPAAFERAALEPWVENIITTDPRLEQYRSDNRQAMVAEFRRLDEKLIKFAYSSVVAACTARRPRSIFGDARIIVREAEKKSRHKPIRTLLEEAGTVAQALKPCFMMSPLSVSQYLPGNMRFDVVIFDEASQVMPADAVNCIYRGSQLIVAGDQKQLPPTAFFTTVADDSDEPDAPDNFDSVLDLCKASGAITSLPLTWHYRSLHEDLITYSNYGFYNGQLNTFPGAVQHSPDLGVHHEFVNGIYQRGTGAKNPIEAERVVDRIMAHRTHNPTLSLGVVTFSTAQADAIFDAIDRRAVHEPVLSGLLEDRDRLRGFFVKNLESVQGDERDIIIFSVGYGPDESGNLAMNFGPLTRKGGQRRLNVAITRARRRVEIVSSFYASQMRAGSSEGNQHLRNYLDFAARGQAALAHRIPAGSSDGDFLLEDEVRNAIESLGYETVTQVGSAGYRVDIGVKHPSKPGTFMLGVECDGVAYSSAKTARDRDRLRGSVLANLGWRMFRVWSLSWYRDPAGQIARLQRALEEAANGAPIAALHASVASSELEEPGLDYVAVDLNAAPDWTVEYTQTRYSRSRASHLVEPGSPEAMPELIEFCTKVIAQEAPLHLDTLQGRLRDTWAIGRVGPRIKENLVAAVGRSRVDGVAARLDNDGFIRLGPPGVVTVRHGGDSGQGRKASAIPPEEFDEAVRLVLRDSMGATEEQVLAAVKTVFGWARSGADVQAAVKKSLYRCQRLGVCEKGEDGTYRLISV
ncbi:DUF3320 domain-containing protein [Specibacter sp. NPDC078692]|uniref:DUF3320 domain-containing protein n=1 Tax=Specibacter sp. NPDC078692 TaxID=3155818 RepID=UPI00343C2FDC